MGLDNNTKSINVVGTWDCDEEITFAIFRGDYSIQSCIVNKFECHFESYSSRMFKHQASRFVDDLWIALKFTNKLQEKYLLV